MTLLLKKIAVVWVIGATVLSDASFAGGDTSILAFWLHLIWTAPAGVLWWFGAYDLVHSTASPSTIQYIGVFVTDVAAFIFWFLFIPKLRKALNRRTGANGGGENQRQ